MREVPFGAAPAPGVIGAMDCALAWAGLSKEDVADVVAEEMASRAAQSRRRPRTKTPTVSVTPANETQQVLVHTRNPTPTRRARFRF